MSPTADGPGTPGRAAGDAAPAFVLDVFVEGERVRRSARVELGEGALRLDDRELHFESVYWASRRAGMLFVFARDFTAALKGHGGDLDELARAVEGRSDRNLQRRRLLQPLAREVVVCTAGTAVSGRIEEERVHGLFLAVFTQRALHLVAGRRHHTLRWPVQRAQRAELEGRKGGQALLLRDGETELRLLYLFPEEIRAVLRVAERAPARPDEPSGEADPLEMFARAEVAPPVPGRLPEFSVSVDTIQEAAARAAERVPVEKVGAGPERDFFEVHFQELGEIALGPLMLRRSAAAGARGLRRAVQAMDAAQLREDARAAVASAADRLYAVYRAELERRLAGRKVSAEAEAALRGGDAERLELRAALASRVERLAPAFQRLEAHQALLLQRLEALETGPPEGDGAKVVEEAAEDWRSELQRLDRAFGGAWRELLERIAEVWSGPLLDRLARAEALPVRRIPEWLQLAAMALGTVVVAALVVALLTR